MCVCLCVYVRGGQRDAEGDWCSPLSKSLPCGTLTLTTTVTHWQNCQNCVFREPHLPISLFMIVFSFLSSISLCPPLCLFHSLSFLYFMFSLFPALWLFQTVLWIKPKSHLVRLMWIDGIICVPVSLLVHVVVCVCANATQCSNSHFFSVAVAIIPCACVCTLGCLSVYWMPFDPSPSPAVSQ